MLLGLLRRQQRQSRVVEWRGTRPRRGWSECGTCTRAHCKDDDNSDFGLQSWLALALWQKYKSTFFRHLDLQSLVRRKISQSMARRYVFRPYLAGMRITYPRVDGRFCGGI